MKNIGFIGGGRVTRIILQALHNEKEKLDHVYVFDINEEANDRLKNRFPEINVADLRTVATRDYIFLALHPPVVLETLEKIEPVISKNVWVISLAPKISMDKIAATLARTEKIIRLIPNATSIRNEGYNPICFFHGFPDEDKTRIIQFLEKLGATFEVAESKLEAYAVLSAMAPTYFWFQWDELCKIGSQMELDKKEIEDTLYFTMMYSLNTMFKSGFSREELYDLITLKPIGEHESEIRKIFSEKLLALYDKIKP